jgi:hypothetical protein
MNKRKIVCKKNELGKHENKLHLSLSLSESEIKTLTKALNLLSKYKQIVVDEFNQKRKCPIEDSSWFMIDYLIKRNKLEINVRDGMVN